MNLLEKCVVNMDFLKRNDVYNLKEGGKGGHFTEETKQKISLANKGKNHPMYGKHHTEETRKKLSEAKKGEKNSMYGKHFSDEAIKKLSEANKKSLEKMKKIILQYTKDGIFIKEWKSAKDAGTELELDNSNITKCCKGKAKTSGGFVWKYKK